MDVLDFLPISKEDMEARGWWWYDFLLVTGDAYVDHPTFGAAVIGRVLEAEGYRVAVLAQPDWHSAEAFSAMGHPRLGILIGAGNLDSMVAHYTAAKKPRREDFYSPGRKAGLRPDRATIVYANRAREAFPNVPIIIGGLEASLRRFAHYDYWDDSVRRSILVDSGADLLVYGMGETATKEIAAALKKKTPVSELVQVRGTAFLTKTPPAGIFLPSFDEIRDNKRSYAQATMTEYEEHDPVRGRTLLQPHGDWTLVVNPPAAPLDSASLDAVAELPYTRTYHPIYESLGGVPAIEEVRFSITHNRGCFGACNFCSLAFHQGRMVTARSADSVVKEATALTKFPDFKGYISDVGGPTANFRHASCKKQQSQGMCSERNCLFPEPCPNLNPDHSDYLQLLRKLRSIDGVKKVFVRSGIRYDYLLEDQNSEFLSELVKYHISGQLRVAPEHCVDRVLYYMGKPRIGVYEKFLNKYQRLNERYEKAQFAVPYLMSSHPGCTLDDAIELASYLNKQHRQPEQVQDFYPTPGTISTCMYYTGLDPRTMQTIYVARTPEEKLAQRALLQWRRPDMYPIIYSALKRAGREDLIGFGPDCLISPPRSKSRRDAETHDKKSSSKKVPAKATPVKSIPSKPQYKAGWAKPKPKKNARPQKKK